MNGHETHPTTHWKTTGQLTTHSQAPADEAGRMYGGMVTTSPDWLIPGIDGGKREDPRPHPPVQSPRGEAEPLAWGDPVSSQGRPPIILSRTGQFNPREERAGTTGSSSHERQRRARAHTKTLPPHTPHRTSHTPRGRSSVCGQGALHRANLRPSPRAAGLTAGQRADDVECAAVASRRRRPGSEDDPG